MDIVNIILNAAKMAKISGAILVAVCSHETGLNNVTAQHDGGSPSIGVCQVKFDTAVMLGYEGDPKGLEDPETNATYAALYLKYQYNRYHDWCRAIAAYNAGRFNESLREPGHPKNLGYVMNVRKKLDKNLQKMISCDRVSSGDIDVAENYGFGL